MLNIDLSFYSNTAATEIQHQTISFLHEGKERDSIQLKDMEVLVTKAAANLKASKSKCSSREEL